METPLSTRRVTRSQTATASASSMNKNTLMSSKRSDESNQQEGLSKSRQGSNGKTQQQETKSALLDITNNSPIVGLAMGNLRQTPSSSFSKKSSSRRKITATPGSGEALLRDQVKTLLQKVEEEAELSKVSLESGPLFHHHFQGFVHSPMGLLLAPTPNNTPQVFNTSEGLQSSLTVTYPDADVNLISQMVNEDEESMESEKSLITRSLLLDFSDKSVVIDSLSEEECYSELTVEEEGKEEQDLSAEEDSASAWSVQVHASSTDDREDYILDEEDEIEGGIDELCLGLENLGLMGRRVHKRFLYNSDDEIVGAEEELKLKGLPTPKGKHIRFPEEEEEDNI